MINNFETIREFLTFPNERSFYFVQILKRKKENPEMKTFSLQIESYYVFSKEQFDRFMPHIIDKCEQNRARAYIKLNTLDALSVGLRNIAVLTEHIRDKAWHALSSAFNSACGQCGMQEDTCSDIITAGNDGKKNAKLYLVDLDGMSDFEDIKPIIDEINALQPVKETEKVKLVLPTRNGCHLITTGFDLKTFKDKHPDIDVHKDGNTILYFPEICG